MTLKERIDKLLKESLPGANPRNRLYMCPEAIDALKECKAQLSGCAKTKKEER